MLKCIISSIQNILASLDDTYGINVKVLFVGLSWRCFSQQPQGSDFENRYIFFEGFTRKSFIGLPLADFVSLESWEKSNPRPLKPN